MTEEFGSRDWKAASSVPPRAAPRARRCHCHGGFAHVAYLAITRTCATARLYWCFRDLACFGAGRMGLKIPWPLTAVWVRFPPPALSKNVDVTRASFVSPSTAKQRRAHQRRSLSRMWGQVGAGSDDSGIRRRNAFIHDFFRFCEVRDAPLPFEIAPRRSSQARSARRICSLSGIPSRSFTAFSPSSSSGSIRKLYRRRGISLSRKCKDTALQCQFSTE